ncbi:MAG: PAS domain-containing protein, partial [Candidatus Hodarchaeota archaeon]
MRRGNSKTISTGKSEFESAEGIAKAILNASTESAMIIALDGTVLAINDIAAHRMGKTAAEVVGNCVYDFFSPEVRQSRKLRVEQAIQSKKQLRFQDEQGGRIFNNSIYPIADKEGYTKQVAIYARDITAQRKMEEALRISEEKFRNLADMLPQAVFELDLEGRFTFVNRIGLEFVGYTQEELEKGLNVLKMFIPADRERVKENIQRKLRGEKLG